MTTYFTGDAFIPEKAVVTVLPNADKTKAKESVDRVLKLAVDKNICSGHEIQKSNKQNAKMSEQRICQFTEGNIFCLGHSTI